MRLIKRPLGTEERALAPCYYRRSHFFSTPVTVLRFRNNQPA